MPRAPREDEPGSWHHVMNRGVARRTMFEGDRDVRYLLAWVARMVQAGRIEVHAFVVMMTHFHFLVRSPLGELSWAMMRIQTEFARWFNRSRRRDGPLHRGRFRSKRVRSVVYRRILVRYIDSNPVLAGMTSASAGYRHGSAKHYARSRGPIWLSRDWVEGQVRDAFRADTYDPKDYPAVFGPRNQARVHWLVQRRIDGPAGELDPLDQLHSASSDQVMDWMRRRAQLADGTGVGIPVADPTSVTEVIDESRDVLEGWMLKTGRKATSARQQLYLALLVDLCALNFTDAGGLVGVSKTGAARLIERHRSFALNDAGYLAQASELARRALARCHESGETVPGTVTA